MNMTNSIRKSLLHVMKAVGYPWFYTFCPNSLSTSKKIFSVVFYGLLEQTQPQSLGPVFDTVVPEIHNYQAMMTTHI